MTFVTNKHQLSILLSDSKWRSALQERDMLENFVFWSQSSFTAGQLSTEWPLKSTLQFLIEHAREETERVKL